MKQKNIITHSSRFHADDIFAVATLTLVVPEPQAIVRTRDESLFSMGDYVVDVGGKYDEASNRFDHHQEGGAGKRPNGIPYASFGLVWKKFGEVLAGSKVAADMIDLKVVQPIDALDNGIDISTPIHEGLLNYNIQKIVSSFVPTWKEGSATLDSEFIELVGIARRILMRELVQAKDLIEAEEEMKKAYEASADKQIIVLDKNYPWDDLMMRYGDVVFVVYPTPGENTWKFGAVRKNASSYESRKLLPAKWAGKRDEELAGVSGVSDAIFCHNKRFMAVAKSKEGAIALAQKALLA